MKKIKKMSQVELAAYIQELVASGGNSGRTFRWKRSFVL